MALPRDLGNLGDVTGGGNANANFDSGTLFIDSVNNRVGIANTTPDVTLRVTGSAGISGTLAIAGNTTVSNTMTVGVPGTVRIAFNSDGSIVANGNITAFGNPSDINLKENIVRLDNALDNIATLSGYTFNYKGDTEKVIGVIAQEVQEVYPELVYTYKNLSNEDSMAVRYSHITAVLIEAVKELKAKVEELESKIAR